MRKLLAVVNSLIALACLVAAGGFYWIFYRALPKTSGSTSIPVAQSAASVRDSLGIPHIKAKSAEDAWVVQGYVTAEDRMFQMDGMRRLGAGDLSEVVGPATLDQDRESRRLQLRRTAERIYAVMPADEKADLAAYARGVNAWITAHRGNYGFEFTALGYDPHPWTVVDSIICALDMYRSLSDYWRVKVQKRQMHETGDPAKVDYLFEGPPGQELPGSNSWVVSGIHSADKKPLLAGDTHLEFSLPGTWHAVEIETPGMKVAGMALPGLPGVIVGHNDRIAWSVTNLGFDVEDIYQEQMNLQDGRVAFAGHVEQAIRNHEVIRVKGGAPEQLDVWVTRHGPVFHQSTAAGPDRGFALSLRWTAFEPQLFRSVFPRLDRAHNWQEFQAALSDFGGPAQNFVYADVDGNIGYHVAGKLPIRDYDGSIPQDGAAGKSEWSGYIPFEKLPQVFNPPSGVIVSANNNVFPADYPYKVTGNFAPPDRHDQITNLLHSAGDKLTPRDNLRIQKDVYSAYHHFIARQVVNAYDRRGAVAGPLDDAIGILRAWNGQMEADIPAPMIASMIADSLKQIIADRASNGSGNLYNPLVAPAAIRRLLTEHPDGWFNDYNALLLRAFTEAMDNGQRLQGKNPKGWKWGKMLVVNILNPVGARIRFVGSWFNIGPLPASGGPTTVKQMTGRLGPSERINISLGTPDASLWNLVIGESGNRASSHYRDQFDAWYYAESFPMKFDAAEGTGVTFLPAN